MEPTGGRVVSRELNTRLSSGAYSLSFPEQLSPSEGGGAVDKYVQQGVSGASPEQSPFRRRIDLWALGLAIAVAEQLPPYEGKLRKFVDTKAVDVPDQVAALMFVTAVAKLGQHDEDLNDTGNVVRLCNQYAASGVFKVVEWFDSRQMLATPLQTALDQARELRHNTAERLVGAAH